MIALAFIFGPGVIVLVLYVAMLIYRRWYYDLDTFFPKGDTPPATRHYLRSRKKTP